MTDSEPKFFEHKGQTLCYEVLGNGPNVVLLIPGAIGTARSDFSKLLECNPGLNPSRFTLVAVDPPGNGGSTPSGRKWHRYVYNEDCIIYSQLMMHLNYDKYSVMGWSEGAKVALLMAIRYESKVESVVLISVTNVVTTASYKGVEALMTQNNWSESFLEPYLKVYGTFDEISSRLKPFLDFLLQFRKHFPRDVFEDKYVLVEKPVFIVHAEDDAIAGNQPIEIYKKLPNVQIYRFADGGHECHHIRCGEFRGMVQKFLEDRHKFQVDPAKLTKLKAASVQNSFGFN